MDDPWGSPWTSTDNDLSLQPPLNASSSPDGPKPPPAAVLTHSHSNYPTLSFPSIADSSPWADDDNFDDNAFGDWATATPSGSGATKSFSTWDGAWPGSQAENSETDQRLSPLPKAKTAASPFFGSQASAIALPNSTAARSPAVSPGMNAMASAGTADYFRPSPDPWAANTTTAENKRGHASAASSSDKSDKGDKGDKEIPPLSLSKPSENPPLAVESKTVQEAQFSREISRPSSPGSDDTHTNNDNEPRQDSPTTSVDDDTHTTDSQLRPRSVLQRKVSPKVQELVELYDGLSSATPRQQSPSSEIEVIDEIQDAEARPETLPENLRDEDKEAYTNTEITDLVAITAPKMPVLSSMQAETTTQANALASPLPHISEVSVTSPVQSSTVAKDRQPSLTVASLLKKFGPVRQYFPDQSKIIELFGGDAQPEDRHSLDDNDASPPNAYIPDHILTDSFTSISERKTWYRISRPGSYRKNNAGDDENYRPITWATSTAVRGDTVRIVRRWMEEDAFTGRPTLGGGAGSSGGAFGSVGARGNLFGWDSAAEAVTLDEVYKKKPKPNDSSSTRAPDYQTHKHAQSSIASVSSLGAPRFNNIEPTMVSSPTAATDVRVTDAVAATAVLDSPYSVQKSLIRDAAVPNPSKFMPQSLTDFELASLSNTTAGIGGNKTKKREDAAAAAADDDEWGDMVSSPTAGEFVSALGSLAPGGGEPAHRLNKDASSVVAQMFPVPTPKSPLQSPVTAGLVPHEAPNTSDFDSVVQRILSGLPDLSYMAN